MMALCKDAIWTKALHYHGSNTFHLLVGIFLGCSSEYRMQSRLVFQRVQIEIDADDLSDCERSCVQEDRFICTGFSFK